jgi:hypothetical protein
MQGYRGCCEDIRPCHTDKLNLFVRQHDKPSDYAKSKQKKLQKGQLKERKKVKKHISS